VVCPAARASRPAADARAPSGCAVRPLPSGRCRPAAAVRPLPSGRCRPAARPSARPAAPSGRCRPAAPGPAAAVRPLPSGRCRPAAAVRPLPSGRCRPGIEPVRRVPGAYARVAAYNGVQGARAPGATVLAPRPLACAVGRHTRSGGHTAGRLAANCLQDEAPRAGPARPRYSYSSPHTKFFLLKKPAYR
jgi:hypothetical protein